MTSPLLLLECELLVFIVLGRWVYNSWILGTSEWILGRGDKRMVFVVLGRWVYNSWSASCCVATLGCIRWSDCLSSCRCRIVDGGFRPSFSRRWGWPLRIWGEGHVISSRGSTAHCFHCWYFELFDQSKHHGKERCWGRELSRQWHCCLLTMCRTTWLDLYLNVRKLGTWRENGRRLWWTFSPEYKDDPYIYTFDMLKHIGIEPRQHVVFVLQAGRVQITFMVQITSINRIMDTRFQYPVIIS